MRSLHIITGIARASGGPSRSVQGLVAGLNRAGVETWLMSLRKGGTPWVDGVERFIDGGSFEDALASAKPDIVHLHGLWNPGLHRCAVACRRRNIPYIIAPRGMLEPWSLGQKKWKKRIARWLYQDRDLHSAAALHATAESEAEQFRRLGFRNHVIISPNGVNVPRDFSMQRRKDTESSERRVLFVSRMHPKKGVLELIEAWGRLSRKSEVTSPKSPGSWICELVYTVNGELERDYEAQVRARVAELGLSGHFVFTGALGDDEKWAAYARADLFVLPTYSENFGIVVAEALYAGVPVITTKGTPWRELEERKCGWWMDIGVEPLAAALREAMSLSDAERREMGGRGRALVAEKYTWDAAVKAMVAGYEAVLGQIPSRT